MTKHKFIVSIYIDVTEVAEKDLSTYMEGVKQTMKCSEEDFAKFLGKDSTMVLWFPNRHSGGSRLEIQHILIDE